ncbi:MAG: hypothetical protein AB7F59_11730 [Bdellovibrionales bacterium]
MSEVPNWVSGLNIKAEDYQEWLTRFPSKDFLLGWAIQTSHLNENTYLQWAHKFYQLPLIKSDFFEQAAPLELWKKCLNGPWSPNALPVAEWDGVVYVGCLEPVTFSQDPQMKIQFLLAPTSAQTKWWGLFSNFKKENGTTVASQPAVAPVVAQPQTPSQAPVAVPSAPVIVTPVAAPIAPPPPVSAVTPPTAPIAAMPPPPPPAQTIAPAPIATPPTPAQKTVPPPPPVTQATAQPIIPPTPPKAPAAAIPNLPPLPTKASTPVPSAPPAMAPVIPSPAASAPPPGIPEMPPISAKPPAIAPVPAAAVVFPPPPTKPNEFVAPINQFLKPEKQVDFSEKKAPAPPAKTKLSVQSSRKDDAISFDHLNVANVDLRIPDGISLTPEELAVQNQVETVTLHNIPDVPEGINVEADGINLKPLDPLMASGPMGLEDVKLENVDLLKVENLIETSQEVELPSLTLENSVVTEPSPLAPPLKAVPPTPVASPMVTQPPPAAPSPLPATPTPVAAPPPVAHYFDPNTNPQGLPDSGIQPVFEKMRTHFEKSMILLMSGPHLQPYQWDPSWTANNSYPFEVSLQTPSVFKIVVDSVQPYHGYMRPSAVNDSFFKRWNNGQYPAHLTAVPISVQNDMLGILVGISQQEKTDLTSLNQCQALAHEIAVKLKQVLETPKAA